MFSPLCCAFLLMICAVGAWSAETYYVDYEDGKDSSTGTSMKAAWKHCPSDRQATAKAAACNLSAGDVVIFKGAVRYRGILDKPFSGAPGKPIVYDGNSAGTFGEGPAIIDGSLALHNWTQCKQATDAAGNPLYKDIWYTDIAHKGSWRALNLLGAEVPMAVSQHPNPKDPLYQEEMSTYLRASMPIKRAADSMSLSDSDNLAGKPDDYYTGMGFCFHGGHNMACYLEVTGFDAQTQTVTTSLFTDRITKNKTYKDGTKYCFFNSVKLIDQIGEYAMQRLDAETVRVFAWPAQIKDGQPKDISMSSKNRGFDLQSVQHVLLRGLKIERQGGSKAFGVYVEGSKDVHVEQCEISQVRGSAGYRAEKCEDISVVDSYVHHLPGHCFGVFMRNSKNCRVIRTKIHKPTSTALDFYTVTGGTVSQCEVSGFTGMHANGLTFYLGNRDILIERNYVHSGNVPLTIKQSANVVIRNNIFDGNNASMCIGMWAMMPHEKKYWKGTNLQNVQILHNTFVRGHAKNDWARGIFSNMKEQPSGLVVKNNILAGVSGKLQGTYAHNLYTNTVNKAFMGDGCMLETDNKKIFVDPDNRDFRLCKDSPAIGAGADLGVEDDFAGHKRSGVDLKTLGAHAGFAK